MLPKICTKCKQEKDISEFHNRPSSKDGHRNECKICVNARNKKWVLNNKEKQKDSCAKWYKNNKDARKLAVAKYHYMKYYGLTLERLDEMLLECNHTCELCG